MWEFSSEKQLLQKIFYAYFPEYAILPVFYFLGTIQLAVVSYALQLVFMAVSSFFQLSAFCSVLKGGCKKGCWSPCNKKNARQLLKPLRKVAGVPVGFLGLSRWQFSILAKAPSGLHVISTVYAVAGSVEAWPPHQEEFARRWSAAPLGSWVGSFGLPNILTLLISVGACLQFVFAMGFKNVAGAAEASNLFFLVGAVRGEGELDGIIVRVLMAPVVKIPLLWAQTSLLSLTYDELLLTKKASNLFAIALAWYGFVDLMPSWWKMVKRVFMFSNNKESLPRACATCDISGMIGALIFGLVLLLFFCLLFVSFVHLVGIFACESHDLSIFQGCTP